MKVADRSTRLTHFENIYNNTFNNLKNVFLKVTRDEELTNDILQTSYLKLWEKLDEIEDKGDYSGLLYIYARNVFRDEMRKKCRQEIINEELGYEANRSANFAGETDIKEYENIIQCIITKMPLKRQRVYRMFKEDGLSYKNIAEHLGISPKTVDNHLNEATKEIRKQIKIAYHIGNLSSVSAFFFIQLLCIL